MSITSLSRSIIKKISQYKVVSFDIFDTLLIRKFVRPTDLFEYIEQHLSFSGFAQARIDAEKQARKKSTKEEITLAEIYDNIASQYRQCKSLEVETELKFIAKNPEIYAVYQYCLKRHKQILFVSDMYLPAEFIKKMLKKCGYNQYDYLWVSSEYGVTKNTGNLYKQAFVNKDYKSIVHIGDNYNSDYLMPEKLGLRGIHYPKIADRFFYNPENLKYKQWHDKYNNNAYVSIILSQIIQQKEFSHSKNYWNDLGFCILGPLVYSYNNYIYQKCNENKQDGVIFVARDGYTLNRCWKLGNYDIPSYYVYAPRFIKTLTDLTYDSNNLLQMQILIEFFRKQYKNQLPPIKKISSIEIAKNYILNNISIFKRLAEQERIKYYKYLQSILIAEKYSMVDSITGHFSSQQLLQGTCVNKNIKGVYLVVEKDMGYSYDEYFVHPKNPFKQPIQAWNFVEFLLGAPEAPIQSVTSEGKAIYQEKISKIEKERIKHCHYMSDGAYNFVKGLYELLPKDYIVLDSQILIDLINLYITEPNKTDINFMGNYQHAYNTEHTLYRPIFLFAPWVNKEKGALLKYLKKIFEIKNEKDKKYKVIRILNIRVKFKRKKFKDFWKKLLSVHNDKQRRHKILYVLGLKLKFKIRSKVDENNNIVQEINVLHSKIATEFEEIKKLECKIFQTENDIFYLKLNRLLKQNEQKNIKINQDMRIGGFTSVGANNIQYAFPNFDIQNPRQLKNIPDSFFTWGCRFSENNSCVVNMCDLLNRPLFILEDGFIRSADTWLNFSAPNKYRDGISYTADFLAPYYDATQPSTLENMLNNRNLKISKPERERARTLMKLIIDNYVTKYNHQPIYTPNIGRQGAPKILVVDQSYGDMSIIKGLATEDTFRIMLEKAIAENPDADIIVKTHPDTLTGRNQGGYYTKLKSENNIYAFTSAINPISLIKYVDKVYVCSTQLGFEALMCGKEVHTFGMPFYAGWGLTVDYLTCDRRKNKRSLEELFYITYVLYSHYMNPETNLPCELEEAISYILKLRNEYFKQYNVRFEVK